MRAQPRPDRRPQRRRAGEQLLGLHAGDHALATGARAGRDHRRAGRADRDHAARPRALQAAAWPRARTSRALPIRTRLSDEEVARFVAQRFRFPGVEIKARLFRHYPLGEIGAHLLGYIGRINQAEKAAHRGLAEDERGQLPRHRVHRQARHRAELRAASCTAPPASSRWRSAPAGARSARLSRTAGRRRATTWCCRSTSGCRRWSSRRSASAAARWWRSSRATASVLAFVSASRASIPTCSSTASMPQSWRELNEIARQAADQPRAARHLSAGLDLQAVHGDGRAELGKRTAGQTISRPRLASSSAATHSATPSAGGHGAVDMYKSIVESVRRLLLHAGQRDGHRRDPRQFMKPFGFGRKTGIDLRRRGDRRAAVARNGSAALTSSPSSRSGTPARRSRSASARATTTSRCCSWPTAMADAGQRRRSVQAAPGARASRTCVTRAQQAARVPERCADRCALKQEHVDVIKRAMDGVTQEGTSARGLRRRAATRRGGKTGTAQVIGIKAEREVQRRPRSPSASATTRCTSPSRRSTTPTIAHRGDRRERRLRRRRAAAPIARTRARLLLLGRTRARRTCAHSGRQIDRPSASSARQGRVAAELRRMADDRRPVRGMAGGRDRVPSAGRPHAGPHPLGIVRRTRR